MPGTSFVMLDALDGFGGTWLTHRHPGIRSDSDLSTPSARASSRGRARRSRVATAPTVVTATGFEIGILGDVAFTIDGKQLDLSDTVTYRGMTFTGVPQHTQDYWREKDEIPAIDLDGEELVYA